MDLEKGNYLLTTLHRPSNVDNKVSLTTIIHILNKYSQNHKIVFPIHPRTKSNLIAFDLQKELSENILLCDPIGYIDFICLVKNAALILTDSGGIQEESTFLEIQCITLRENTERPITVEMGTNHLIGSDLKKIDGAIMTILGGKIKKREVPPFWDGKAAERICETLMDRIAK